MSRAQFFFPLSKQKNWLSREVAKHFPLNNYSNSSNNVRSSFENHSQKTKTNFLAQQVNLTHPEGFQNCQNFPTIPSAQEEEESIEKEGKSERVK